MSGPPNIGCVALQLKRELRWTDGVTGLSSVVELGTIRAIWPKAVGLLVVFESEAAARAAVGPNIKLLETRWWPPGEYHARTVQEDQGNRPHG